MRLGGVLDMLDGLEHHIRKIRTYEKAACRYVANLNALTKTKKPFNLSDLLKRANYKSVVHDLVAYIGRLGQLSCFFESEWFSDVVNESDIALKIPSVLALMPLRNKHSAHRQQDYPRKDDCTNLGINEYGLKPVPIGFGEEPKSVNIRCSFPTKQRHPLLVKYHPDPISDIEHFGQNNNLVLFNPTKNHQKIINETISLLERFFGFQP